MKFSLFAWFGCLLRGHHRFTNSKSRRGLMTCERCGVRRRQG